MSHNPEREEKTCLNCNAVVYGRYCHVCGQENIEPKESFWHLITHFTYDLTHFDGKFFSTLKYLLFRPGYLSLEYLKGRRVDYLHPIRMYIFTSAFFFLIFFSFYHAATPLKITEAKLTAAETKQRLEKSKKNALAFIKDTSLPVVAKKSFEAEARNIDSDLVAIAQDTMAKDHLRSRNNFNGSMFSSENYTDVRSYDSIQSLLPEGKRDGWLQRKFVTQYIHLKEEHGNDNNAIMKSIGAEFLHLFPQMLFVSLPLFALLLLLLYVRRKELYYVNHVIFTVHLYCGIFIIILSFLVFKQLLSLTHINQQDLLTSIFWLLGFFYCYKALRNFYRQSRGKTILKYILLLFLALIVWVVLFCIFFLLSIFII